MKDDLLLLHGAVGARDQLRELEEELNSHYTVHSLNFPGHGGTNMPAEFSIPGFARHVADYCGEQGLQNVYIFGYSMGGYVALYLAKHYSQLPKKIITLATKFSWNESIAAKEIQMLQPTVIEEKLPQFAQALQQRHAPGDWKNVLHQTALLIAEMGKQNVLLPDDYRSISTPSLLLSGDRDKMVPLEETIEVYRQLPHAQLAILPGTSHPVEAVDKEMLAGLIKRFAC
jgi:pimeloyl-ACP methyl ester carboxylesterase